MSIADDTSIILNDRELLNLTQSKVGKKKDKVWEYFNIINVPNSSHKGAQCKFCSQTWKRGKPIEMKAHLALRCSMVKHDVKVEYLHIVANENNIDEQQIQNQTNNKSNNEVINIANADKALVRFFVCCGIPFSVVDSPFFLDFIKSLCYNYEPPKRTALSTTHLNAESASIVLKIEEELHQSSNLTLGQLNFFLLI
jgi:hypothetical protein